MSTFGLKILIRVVIPYTFGLFFIYWGGRKALKKERTLSDVIYLLGGLFLSIGAVWHLLFVADVSMYS